MSGDGNDVNLLPFGLGERITTGRFDRRPHDHDALMFKVDIRSAESCRLPGPHSGIRNQHYRSIIPGRHDALSDREVFR